MFFARTAPTTGHHSQRQTAFLSRAAAQAGSDGCGLFIHAPLSSFSVTGASLPRPMTKKTVPGNPASALPIQGLSKRAQALLKPVPNQVVLANKGQADKTRSILKGGI
jgi:hypothetical protein